MKIRNGFVSNSSSSSFIVCFPKRPTKLTEVQELLFGEEDAYGNPYFDHRFSDPNDSAGWAASTIAGIVYDDIKKQSAMTKEEVIEESDGCLEYPWRELDKVGYGSGLTTTEQKRVQEKMDKIYEKHTEECKATGKAFFENNDGVFYKFEFSDNDGEMYSAMEHGDLFKNLPHIKISHH